MIPGSYLVTSFNKKQIIFQDIIHVIEDTEIPCYLRQRTTHNETASTGKVLQARFHLKSTNKWDKGLDKLEKYFLRSPTSETKEFDKRP